MEQYELPFNKYEDPTVELDFDSDWLYWIALDDDWEYFSLTHLNDSDPQPF